MIRRDYILRMIEEFIRALAKIKEQKQQGLWREAAGSLEEQARRLTGCNLATICTLTDTELLACLLKSGEFQAPTEKSFMLARVLIESGEIADAENRESASTALRIRALHLLLHTSLRGDVHEWPEFVPAIDLLLRRFARGGLPIHTQALLMQHFERAGEFAKAKDALQVMLEAMPDNTALREMAISFYRRLLTQSDEALETVNLPRNEINAALEAIRVPGA